MWSLFDLKESLLWYCVGKVIVNIVNIRRRYGCVVERKMGIVCV